MEDNTPRHLHVCRKPEEWTDNNDSWEEHEWRCSSPYCNTRIRVCPKHGGKRPQLAE